MHKQIFDFFNIVLNFQKKGKVDAQEQVVKAQSRVRELENQVSLGIAEKENLFSSLGFFEEKKLI